MGLSHSVSSKAHSQRVAPGFRAASVSMQGFRPEMEDAHAISVFSDADVPSRGAKAASPGSPSSSSSDSTEKVLTPPVALFAVFDGHCGKRASAFCAKAIKSTIITQCLRPSEVSTVSPFSHEIANPRYSAEDVASSPMGPTFSCAEEDQAAPVPILPSSSQDDVTLSLQRASMALDVSFFRNQLGIPDGTTSVFCLASYDEINAENSSAGSLASGSESGFGGFSNSGNGSLGSDGVPLNVLGSIAGDGRAMDQSSAVDGESGVVDRPLPSLQDTFPSRQQQDQQQQQQRHKDSAPRWRNDSVLNGPHAGQQILLHVANLGDSRALLLRPSTGEWVALTKDHKPDNDEERRRIMAAGGHVADSRVDGDLALSRAIGDVRFKQSTLTRNPIEQKVISLPDVCSRRAIPGDILLVACDGYFEATTNADIMTALLMALEETDGDLGESLRFLTDYSLDRGSKDNMTAIAVEFTGATQPPVVSTSVELKEKHGLHVLPAVPKHASVDWFVPGPYKIYAPTRGSGFHRSFFEFAQSSRFSERQIWDMVEHVGAGTDYHSDDDEDAEPTGLRAVLDPRIGFSGRVARVLVPHLDPQAESPAWFAPVRVPLSDDTSHSE